MAATIIVGTNSWVTIAESDSYLEEKWNADAWASLTDSQKTQLLITAYRWINADDNYEIAASSTDDNVKYAQIETAWYCYKENDAIEKRMGLQAQGVESFDISRFSEDYKKPGSRLPDVAQGLLDGYESYGVVAEITRTLD